MQSDTSMEQDAFDLAMRFSSAYRERNGSDIWELFRKRYLEFIKSPPARPKIPKKLHQIWLGSELPDIYKSLIEKLQNLHPEWEYKLWTDRDILHFDFPNKNLFMESQNMGQKSDILRYEILNSFGGIYLDLDFAAIKPLDSLLGLDAFAGVAYDSDPNLLSGIIGCIPNTEFSKKLVNLTDIDKHSSGMQVIKTTGPYFLTKIFQEEMKKNPLCLAMPNTYFYPFPNFPKDRILGENLTAYSSPESYCCHLWHCSWLKKPHNTSSRNKSVFRNFFSFLR